MYVTGNPSSPRHPSPLLVLFFFLSLFLVTLDVTIAALRLGRDFGSRRLVRRVYFFTAGKGCSP